MSLSCADSCFSVALDCLSACAINQQCERECYIVLEECETFCPSFDCDINTLSSDDKITVNRNMAFSGYEGKPAVAHWKGYSYIYLPEMGYFEQVFLFDGINVGATFGE